MKYKTTIVHEMLVVYNIVQSLVELYIIKMHGTGVKILFGSVAYVEELIGFLRVD